jgi:DNA-binding transcriptional MerR regulator
MYTPGQFAKRVGVSVKTIQKWDRLGILPATRTITNRRYYTDEELAAALRLPRQHKPRVTIAYCRVASQAQKADLQNQQAVLEKFCRASAIEVDEWVLEIGGGLNFERKQFLKLVDRLVSGGGGEGGAGPSGSARAIWLQTPGPPVPDASDGTGGDEHGDTFTRARVSPRLDGYHPLL